MVLLSMAIFGIRTLSNPTAVAAEQTQSTEKPKTKSDAKALPSILAKLKFQTPESEGKARTYSGTAPKIEKISSDENNAAGPVTTTGINFGAVECLRTVSFES